MNASLDEKFLDSLIEKTKTHEINWIYLDQNANLCANLNININHIITDDSFYLPLSNSFIVLAHFEEFFDSEDEYILYIVPNTFRQVKKLYSDDQKIGEKIIRLDNLIKLTFPNPEDIMDNFIKFGDDDLPF